jgi:hypothetical protein
MVDQIEHVEGAWGAGFLVRDPRDPARLVVHTFAHTTHEDGTVERRRIALEATRRGFMPCSPYLRTLDDRAAKVITRPTAMFCFEIDPDGRAFPHLRNHPEWLGAERERVISLLRWFGLDVDEG